MEKASQKLGIILKYFADLTSNQITQLKGLEGLYKEWNQVVNVISRKDIEELYLHHVLHSLSIATVLEDMQDAKNIKIIDIGCGGGFPGIPLAIFYPNVQFYLVDSIGKKLNVVSDICEKLQINNVIIKHTRVEEIKNLQFDIAVSRAVAPLQDLWKWANPILKKNTQLKMNGLITLKGGDLTAEIAALPKKVFTMPLHTIFKEDYFAEKLLLFVKK